MVGAADPLALELALGWALAASPDALAAGDGAPVFDVLDAAAAEPLGFGLGVGTGIAHSAKT